MDRDRDDDRNEDRRPIPRGRGIPGPSRDDRAGDKFDPAEFDMPPAAPPPTTADRMRGTADFAQFFKLVSALETGMQRILSNFGMFRDVLADSRASSAEAAAVVAKHAEEQAARDKIITERLIDPEQLGAYAAAGAKIGVKEAIGDTVARLERRIDADMAAHELLSKQMAAEQAERRAYDTRRHLHDRLRNAAILGLALLVPVSFGLGGYFDHQPAEAEGYARARDEVAAASWANTDNGKLARKIDQASQDTLPAIANCPTDHGWERQKRQGVRYCFGANHDTKPYDGWPLP